MIDKTKLPVDISLEEAINTLWGQEFREVSLQIIETLPNIQFAAEKFFSAGGKIISLERFINELNRYWIDPDCKISGFEVVRFDRSEFGLNNGMYSLHPEFVRHRYKWIKVPEGVLKKHHRKPWCLGGREDSKNMCTVSRKKHFAFHVLFNTNAGAMSGEEVIKYAGLIYQCIRIIFFDENGNLLGISEVLKKILDVWPTFPNIKEMYSNPRTLIV